MKKMFSRPDSSGSNPVPSSMIGATRPRTTASPAEGVRIPAATRSRVDLPAPFAPMMPSVSPPSALNVTSCKARKS